MGEVGGGGGGGGGGGEVISLKFYENPDQFYQFLLSLK